MSATRSKRCRSPTRGDETTDSKRRRFDKEDQKVPLRELVVLCNKLRPEGRGADHAELPRKTETSDTSIQSSDDEDTSGQHGIGAYEHKRLQNIKDNAEFFAKLGISELKNQMKESKTKLKPSQRGLKKEKPAPLPRRSSLRLQRISPDGLTLPPLPMVLEPVYEHARKPSGPLKMEEYLLREENVDDHKEMVTCIRGLENRPSGADNSKNTSLDTFMKDFRKIRLTTERVAKVVPNRVFSLDIHPHDNRVLAVAGDKWGAVGLWDVLPGREHVSDGVVAYTPHSRPVNCLRFSPWNWRHLYSCSYDGTLRLGDLEKEVFHDVYATPEDHDNLLKNFDFLSADTLLVSQQDGSVAVVDRRTQGVEAENTYKLHLKSLRTVSIHPVQKHIFASASNDGTVCVWDNRNLKAGGKSNKPIDLVQHSKGVASAYFSPVTGRHILVTCMDDTISVVDSSAPRKSFSTQHWIKHDNHVGRWLTNFRASWHPRREDMFVVGSMKRPRQIDIYSDTCDTLATFSSEDALGSVCSLNVIHPTRNILVGANSSGRLHAFM